MNGDRQGRYEAASSPYGLIGLISDSNAMGTSDHDFKWVDDDIQTQTLGDYDLATSALGNYSPSFRKTIPTNWTRLRTSSDTDSPVDSERALAAWIDSLGGNDTEAIIGEELTQYASRRLRLEFANDGQRTARLLIHRFVSKPATHASIYAICDAVGRVSQVERKVHALFFLAAMLEHPRADARDAALLGLALLDDKRAVGAIRKALGIEPRRFLRETMQEVIAQL